MKWQPLCTKCKKRDRDTQRERERETETERQRETERGLRNRHLFLDLQRAFNMYGFSFLVHVSVYLLTICLPSVTGS